ncbi:MAG: endolytic transglycosylase MltG [Muribaculaceae bacterium]|nr:endolytic transglycosylase MltG [Muribaculaceae bacterium]
MIPDERNTDGQHLPTERGNAAPIPRRSRTAIIIACAAGLVVAVLLLVAAPYFLTGTANAAIIRIPRTATKKNLTDTLTKYFDKDFAGRTTKAFTTMVKNPAERYGAYEIPEGTSPASAAKILARGAQTQVTLTINGVRELLPFADRIARKFDFSGDELRHALSDSLLLAQYGLTTAQAPALFLNDTYYLYWNDTPQDLLRKLGDNYRRVWNDERRRKAEALGMTPADVMTIASIVDEETNQLSEKGRVGRLYINRLKIGMKLQADPTVRFALRDFTIRRVTGQHLQAPGPYNTYRVKGLPPGPIRTTSQATIDAILDSKPSDDIYMCAREDFSGFHNFASTYEQHLENARRYQKALDERGIK